MKSGNLQEEFAPFASLRGSSTGVVRRVEGLPPTLRFGDLRRGRMSEAGLAV